MSFLNVCLLPLNSIKILFYSPKIFFKQFPFTFLKYIPSSITCCVRRVVTVGVVSYVYFLLTCSLRMYNERRRNSPSMKGVVISSCNGISSIEIRNDLPVPKILDPDEVLIKVIAAGLDTMDLMITWGYGKSMRSFLRKKTLHGDNHSTVLLGRECSGIVLDAGKDVSSVSKGDEVWVVSPYCLEGLMAEYVVVKERQVSLKPRNLTFEEAAALPYTAIQVNNIMHQARLDAKSTKGQRILVFAGNSPSGLFALQLLKAWGGIITTCVPTAGLPMCHILEVDDVIVYTVTDFEMELRKRKRFDIVINTLGTIVHPFCTDIISPGGKIVTFAITSILSDKFGILLGTFITLAVQVLAFIRKINKGKMQNFWWESILYDREYLAKTSFMVEEGKISPVIQEVYDMDDAFSAFQLLARYENVGKRVLRISKHSS